MTRYLPRVHVARLRALVVGWALLADPTRLPTLTVAVCAGGLFVPFAPAVARAATLPQEHAYQLVLRNYLASLRDEDLEVSLVPLTFDPAYFGSDDELYRAWLLSGNVPAWTGIRLPAAHFALRTIEGDQAVMMDVRRVAPEALAWWTTWAYPGNPYVGSAALKKRAFVAAVVDLMMLDAAHERGSFTRSDFLGGTLIWLAYTYGAVQDELPSPVRNAYATGLRKFVDRLERWGPTGIHADMDTFAVVGLWYTAQALREKDILQRAEGYARRLLERHLHPAGYVDHGGGFDASYNGISLYFLTWAALATDWPFVSAAHRQMSRLKSYLTLPEPDGRTYFGPSHFSTSTSADSANDQWAFTPREIGAGMLADEALYLLFARRGGLSWAWAVPDPPAMELAARRVIDSVNAGLTPLDVPPLPWQETHWAREINYAHDFYVAGFYDWLRLQREIQPPELSPPFGRGSQFLLDFDETFLIARFPDYGVILHTGDLSWWEGITGFGGGALSAFWTPETGSALLGRRRGFQHDNPDRWDEWRIWPTHAISGSTPDGRAFTSARFKFPEKEYSVETERAVVSVTGRIGDEFTAQDGSIRGQVAYSRQFVVEPEGLTLETTLTSDGQDEVTELYEVIPVFLRDTGVQPDVPHRILFWIGAEWVEATGELHENVSRINVERFAGAIFIDFASPQRVRLSPQVWADTYQSRATCRNILVDLLGTSGRAAPMPAKASVRYRVSAP